MGWPARGRQPRCRGRAAADGTLDLHVGNDAVVPLRVVGHRRPGADGRRSRTPFRRGAARPVPRRARPRRCPGSGRPSEMWIDSPTTGARLDEVRAALTESPFRFAQVTARADLVAERSADPVSQAIVWALLAAALAGLVLSVGRARSLARSPTCATNVASWPTWRPRACSRASCAGTCSHGRPGWHRPGVLAGLVVGLVLSRGRDGDPRPRRRGHRADPATRRGAAPRAHPRPGGRCRGPRDRDRGAGRMAGRAWRTRATGGPPRRRGLVGGPGGWMPDAISEPA